MRDVGGTGLGIKRIAVIGIAGGLTIGVSDYWVDQWFSEDTSEKNRERKRAATQAAIGIGAAYIIKRWSRDAAIGVAAGGIVGAVVRLWDSENMADKMSEWFDDAQTDSPPAATNPPRSGGAVYGERVVITTPRERRSVQG